MTVRWYIGSYLSTSKIMVNTIAPAVEHRADHGLHRKGDSHAGPIQ
jgi:hypothetical protein